MPGHDIEPYLILDGSLVQSDDVQVNHNLPALLEVSRRASNASFHKIRLQMIHQHCHPISLPRHLHRLPEHFHRLYLAFLLYLTQLNLFSRLRPSLHNSASYHCAFSFDLEAVIDEIEELALRISLRQ